MRSLNTDAGKVKYIAGKGETKKRSLKKDETEWGSMNWMEKDSSQGISNRAVPRRFVSWNFQLFSCV